MRLLFTALACLISLSVFGQFCVMSNQTTVVSNKSELNALSGCTEFYGNLDGCSNSEDLLNMLSVYGQCE